MKPNKASTVQAVKPLKLTLKERLERVRVIQESTIHRNKRLRAGLWNSEEDETLEVNVHMHAEHA
jgi:hypothetical protein